MTQSPRKEIIQLNGMTILVIMTLVANVLIAGFFYRYHNHQLFLEEKTHNKTMTQLQDVEEHQLKNDIVAREGAPNWNATRYMRTLGTSENPLK